MNNAFFTNIIIENFKSLRKVELKDCRRINVLIGKPNVGKSNFLEALSFFSLAHNLSSERTNRALESYIRYENISELFFDGNREEPIRIQTNLIDCTIQFDGSEGLIIDLKGNTYKSFIKYKSDGHGISTLKPSPLAYGQLFKQVKRYIFENHTEKNGQKRSSNTQRLSFLKPPYGTNLMETIERNATLTSHFITIFNEYGLGLLFDKSNYTLRILKQLKNNKENILTGLTLPYRSMADTLQRIIFYKTAITSNQDSILLLEEPEAHSFPPYIVDITQSIIYSKSNQFFITTHSPFVLNDLLENGRDELAVFLMDWDKENGETIIKRLTDNQLYDIYQYGVDLFTNLETFL
jgi:AAA15 family ATPase/GTPase